MLRKVTAAVLFTLLIFAVTAVLAFSSTNYGPVMMIPGAVCGVIATRLWLSVLEK